MSKLQEFIRYRMRELSNEEATLRHRLSLVEAERDQLRAAAAAGGVAIEAEPAVPLGGGSAHDPAFDAEEAREAASDPASLQAIEDEFSRLLGRPIRRSIPEKTIKEAVIDVLTDAGRGLMAIDILAAINKRFEMDYPRTSLSPQLSRLKSEGKLEREGMVWSLAKTSSENEEAANANLTGGASAASKRGDI
jgi:hypothetical protein